MFSHNRSAALTAAPKTDAAGFPLATTLLREYEAIDASVRVLASLSDHLYALRHDRSCCDAELREEALEWDFDGIADLLAFGDLPDAQELAGDVLISRSSTEFRLTRAFESDYAEYGQPARRDSAAAELIFGWHDLIAQAVADGRTETARQLARLV